jgi:UMF1 family MFS transporter
MAAKEAEPTVNRPAMFAWCSFDWANSAFPTVVLTFVFAAYFAKGVAADEVTGTSQWAFTISLSMGLVALTSPILGAVADAAGRRKPWVFVFSLIAIAATALLWFARPDPSAALWTLLCVAVGNFAFEMAFVFYNAILPAIAPREMIGRLSGWGWGLGYAGGLVCLVIALFVFVQPDPPPFGLDRAAAEHVRATALLVAAWFAVFSVPFFLFVPDTPAAGRPIGAAVREAIATLRGTVTHLGRYRSVALFLIAHMIYTDGLNTLFSVGGLFAAVTFGMDFDEILLFGIALNITSGVGAFAFGWVDDRIGPKRTILIALAALMVLGAALLLVQSKTWFWALALPMGIFFGPAQSASRSLMARLTPPALSAEMFGLFSLSGKATAFMGPAIFGWVTQQTASQRAGLATVLIFYVIGAALLLPVSERRAGGAGD